MNVQDESFSIKTAIISLAVILTIVSIIGNGSFLAIFARFKVFRRNFSNILFANLAVVNFLNPLFNVPLFDIIVAEPSWLQGKAWAIISTSLHMEFNLLNLFSMTVLMLDRFLAVYLGMKYFTWKSAKKAKIAVFIIWLLCAIVVVLFAVPLFSMELDGVQIIASGGTLFKKRKIIIAPIIAFCTIASTVLGILTSYAIHQKKKERIQLNLPPLTAEARLQNDIKATKTVSMAIALYYICYIPTIAFSIWRHIEEKKVSNVWFGVMVIFATFLSSALNPIIYVLRSRRHRSAFRQLLKDPFGTSPYRDNPVRKENEARPRGKNPQIGEEKKIPQIAEEERKPQIAGEELKDSRDPGPSVRPGPKRRGNDTTRPTIILSTSKRQIHPSQSVAKLAWEKNEEDNGSLDQQVAVAR
ncbi:hypothetical protein ACROYT_G029307 [Oculina patagonica]